MALLRSHLTPMKHPFTMIALAALSTGPAFCQSAVTSWQKQPDGVTIKLTKGALRLQALAPKIVRVRFSPTGRFAAAPALAVNARFTPTPWTLTVTPGAIAVVTPVLQTSVSRATGAVRFLDTRGRPLLSEVPDGRTLTPTTIATAPNPTPSLKATQRFVLPAGEALYGLGQHQAGVMNYRGTSVTLEQVNREVAIPFLVSSRGYGLLWNNPASTVVNAGGTDVVPIPAAQVFGADGKPGAWTGEYFVGPNFEKSAGTRADPQIDFDWKGAPLPGVPAENFSVRWTGDVTVKQGGVYTFVTNCDDGSRLWVDGKPIIDDWSVHPARPVSARVTFAPNSRHHVRMEYYQDRFDAVARLGWRLPGSQSDLSWTSEASSGIDYYFFGGPQIAQVIAGYRQATGAAPLPPKWALGFWQSKERYNTQQEWLDIGEGYRSRRLPIDNLVQDWFYWNPHPWGSHQFDAARYPDPAAGIRALHDKEHLHFMISVWGKFEPGSAANPDANFDAMNARGYLYPEMGERARYYDAFNPNARALYWQLMRSQIFDKGVDAWWLDASEPEVDFRAWRVAHTALGPGATVLNAWPLMHTTGVSQGQLQAAPDKRVFILTRSAYAGQQRTGAATWSGDITASWDVYAHQIPAGLNFCLSGIPYWTTDIGAFFVPGGAFPGGSSNPAYRELFTRWFQFGSFCPIFRVHGTDTPKELWRFGPDTQPILAEYDTLRYRLMPYTYSQAWHVTQDGSTLMRGLVMDFQNDPRVFDISDEFLFGPSLLVCPVTKPGATTRAVYLPAGTRWTDFWTGRSQPGGRTMTANAPIQTMPLYVRAGAILPMGPELQYTGEKPADPIELRVYPGADGAFTLYEDEGDNNGYRKGRRATIPMTWNDKTRTLTLGARRGTFPGMLLRRAFQIVWVRPGLGTGVAPTPVPSQAVVYTGKSMTLHETPTP